jgi:hypothetical protein
MKNNEKTISRPVRSFQPISMKPVKTLHFRGQGAQYIGETEPTWPSIDEQEKWNQVEYEKYMSVAFNWYASTQEDKEIVDLGLHALTLSGHFPELIIAIKNSTFPFSLTAAKLLRMAHCGLYLHFHERRFVVKQIKKCLDSQKEIIEKSVGAIVKPSIQDYLNARLHKTKGEIDGQFDQFINDGYTYGGLSAKKTLNKKPLSTVSAILKEPEFTVPANRAKDLIDHCQKYVDEYKIALSGKNEQIAEAYSFLGKRKIKAAIEYWSQAINDITIFGQQKQSMHKTRTRKPKPPSKIVAKLKFLKEFKELGLVSIDPTQVLKCSEIWVYNTRLRKIGHYISLNDKPFEVKSTRLINLDVTKSVQKTLRKPAEQLKEFSNYSKPGMVKWFNNIRAVATPLREAINGDSILLKGIK